MAPGPDDQLRELVRQRAQELRDDAIEADGEVSPDRVDALEHLARLVRLSDSLRPRPARQRWPLAAALFLTLIVASVLLFARVPQTEIELDLSVSELAFTLDRQQVLTDGFSLDALGISGLAGIELPRLPDLPAIPAHVSGTGVHAIRVALDDGEGRSGAISLDAMTVPGQSRVSLRHSEAPGRYRLTIDGGVQPLEVAVQGAVGISLGSARAQKIEIATPGSIHLQPGRDPVHIDLSFPIGITPASLAPQLAVTKLELSRVDDYRDPERTFLRQISSIEEGALYLEALNGEVHRIRPAQALRFEIVRGTIRKLALHAGHIALGFNGDVRGLSSGSYTSSKDLMPTCLEWLQARHGLSLLWGTALYLFGLIVGVMRWWGVQT